MDEHDFICKYINELNVRYVKKFYCESQLFTHAKSVNRTPEGLLILTLNKTPYQTWFEYFKSISGDALLLDCGLALRLVHIIFDGKSNDIDELVFYSSYGLDKNPEDLYISSYENEEERTLISHLSEKKHMGIWLFSFNQKDYIGLTEDGMKKADLTFWKSWLSDSIELPNNYVYLGDYNNAFRRYLINENYYLLSKQENIKVRFHLAYIVVSNMFQVPLSFKYDGFYAVREFCQDRSIKNKFDDRGFLIEYSDISVGIISLKLAVVEPLQYIGQEMDAKITMVHTSKALSLLGL